MKLKDALESYYDYSRKASDILRYLGLIGIGIIWIFRLQTADKVSLPKNLILPTCLLIMGLILDLFQYIAGTIIWGAYHRYKEKREVKDDDDFMVPRQLNWPTNVFFWSKFILISTAYFLILSFLGKILSS